MDGSRDEEGGVGGDWHLKIEGEEVSGLQLVGLIAIVWDREIQGILGAL